MILNIPDVKYKYLLNSNERIFGLIRNSDGDYIYLSRPYKVFKWIVKPNLVFLVIKNDKFIKIISKKIFVHGLDNLNKFINIKLETYISSEENVVSYSTIPSLLNFIKYAFQVSEQSFPLHSE